MLVVPDWSCFSFKFHFSVYIANFNIKTTTKLVKIKIVKTENTRMTIFFGNLVNHYNARCTDTENLNIFMVNLVNDYTPDVPIPQI